MRIFPKETWSYAVLLIILFGIATIAVWQTITFLETRVPNHDIGIVTALMWSLTLGFMLIAGAFGIWSIQFAAGAESRRRIAEIVSSMDYIQDGLLAVDHHDRVTGCNPTGEEMLHDQPYRKRSLTELFPSLKSDDIDLLLHQHTPQEVERTRIDGGLTQALRFRSQPSQGITLLLVSDVSTAQAQRKHRQQAAKLQLVGQLARAVATDFNNLLCGIAGHAALLPRLPPGAHEMADSIQAIADSAERGIGLAGHLMELSHTPSSALPAQVVDDHVTTAVNALRDTLPDCWSIKAEITETPATSLTGMQIEQVVFNLGLIIAGKSGDAGVISVILAPPGSHPLLNIGERFSGGIVLTCAEVNDTDMVAEPVADADDSGLLLSVIQSILESGGGKLDQLSGAEGRPIFRISLPVATAFDTPGDRVDLPFDIDRYLANWNVLIAGRKHRHLNLIERLQKLEVAVTQVDSITAILAATEEEDKLDAVVIDWHLLGPAAEGTLRALAKLSPRSGIVVLHDARPRSSQHQLTGVVYSPEHARTDRVLMAMVEARSIAAARDRDPSA